MLLYSSSLSYTLFSVFDRSIPLRSSQRFVYNSSITHVHITILPVLLPTAGGEAVFQATLQLQAKATAMPPTL